MITIPYPAANLFPMKYATIWRRFWAAILDTLIFVPVIVLTYYLRHHTQSPWLLAIGVLLTSLCGLTYSIAMHSATGQTLGKMVAQIRVVDEDELWTPSVRQAFMMNIGTIIYAVCTIGLSLHAIAIHTYSPQSALKDPLHRTVWYLYNCWILADFICIFCNRKHRSLHDLIARTVVVRDRDYVLELGLRLKCNPAIYPAPIELISTELGGNLR